MGDRPNWQPFENVIGTPDALNQYYRKYPNRFGNDIWQRYKNDHPTNFKISRSSIIKGGGIVTVRIQDSVQSPIKHVD